MKKHKKWTQQDTRRLMVAYNMGAKYSWLCQIFDRSSSSINKYLHRSGIRPLGIAKGNPKFSPLVTLEEIWAEIERQEKLYPMVELPVRKPRLKKPVYIKVKKNKDLTLPAEEIYCDDLQQPIRYLASIGFIIKKIQGRWADYAINSKLFSAYQVLILANRNRCEKGLQPFIVTGFTE